MKEHVAISKLKNQQQILLLLLLYLFVELQSLQEKYSQELDKLKNELILEKGKVEELELELENQKLFLKKHPNNGEMKLMTVCNKECIL